MTTTDYAPPVSQLLSLGDVRGKEKLDYLALGLGPDHVPELCRMVLDKDLWWADSDTAEVWSAVHAWRALAQIGSPDAIESLLEVMGRIDEYDDDWTMEELPDVFAAIGPVAIPPLIKFLADNEQDLWSRVTCVACFEKMAEKHPETRQECIDIVTGQLKRFQRQDETLNGFLISALTDFEAVDVAPLMQRAFDAGRVDWSVAGDWEDVQIELGLLKRHSTPKPRFFSPSAASGVPSTPKASKTTKTSRSEKSAITPERRTEQRQRKAKAKKKRKQQKRSRRKQRK
jgi:hypothetical protein